MVLKQFKLKSQFYVLVRFNDKREIGGSLTMSDNFNVDMHSDVYESIWLKLGVMIETIVLYILILI